MDSAIRVCGSGSNILPVCGASARLARKQVAASASGFAGSLTVLGFGRPLHLLGILNLLSGRLHLAFHTSKARGG